MSIRRVGALGVVDGGEDDAGGGEEFAEEEVDGWPHYAEPLSWRSKFFAVEGPLALSHSPI